MQANVTDNCDGTYALQFSLALAGAWALTVLVGRQGGALARGCPAAGGVGAPGCPGLRDLGRGRPGLLRDIRPHLHSGNCKLSTTVTAPLDSRIIQTLITTLRVCQCLDQQ